MPLPAIFSGGNMLSGMPSGWLSVYPLSVFRLLTPLLRDSISRYLAVGEGDFSKTCHKYSSYEWE